MEYKHLVYSHVISRYSSLISKILISFCLNISDITADYPDLTT